jgi:histidinol-phosphate aminotransferase
MSAFVPAVRPCIERITEYFGPADPVAVARELGVPIDRIIKLDANENPYGPSPLVVEALSSFRHYHWYPDAEQRVERELSAAYVNLPVENIVMGNGSDEVIDLLMRIYLDPGDEVVDFPPSFGIYQFNTQHQDARVISVERDARFGLDVDQALARMTPRTKLIFVATPNNPTGNVAATEDLMRLIDSGRIVVVDEAYAEFAACDPEGFDSLIQLVPTTTNLVVLRTYSKWAGLAGLRVGYAAMPTSIAQHYWKLKPPFNVNAAALAAVGPALEDRDNQMRTVQTLIAERDRLVAELSHLPMMSPFPTRTNFILSELQGIPGARLRDQLRSRGILTRAYGGARLERCLRISVGKPEQNDALLSALREIQATL